MHPTTPMMRQYYDIKSQYPDCIVFFRLGDFYEMFDDDAVKAARLLDITLTSREAGARGRIPMCGVPHHAADGYIASLVGQGYKVALCEQVEDPKQAKGVVKREVVRIFTPGTTIDGALLDPHQHHYLAAIALQKNPRPSFGFAYCDPSTGDFSCTQFEGDNQVAALREELLRIGPAEVLIDESIRQLNGSESIVEAIGGLVEWLPATAFQAESARRRLLQHFRTESLESFGCESLPGAVAASGAILSYLEQTHKTALTQVTKLTTYTTDAHMILDQATRRNLELVRTIRSGEKKGSLLWLLDETQTAMGGRFLRNWILQPLIDLAPIQRRLDAVDELVGMPDLRYELQALLQRVADIERLVGRVAYGSAGGRDLKSLETSLKVLPTIKNLLLSSCQSDALKQLGQEMDPCTDLAHELARALVDEPPVAVNAGGLIRPGFHEEVDKLRQATEEGKTWVADLEATERQRTGIKSLKVGFNKVFGYYLEVTKPNLSLVPPEYERRQTLANAERFITPELKEKEALILGAEDRLIQLEYELFLQLRAMVATQIPRLQKVAKAIAEIDVYVSLAHVAVSHRFVKPTVDASDTIDIVGGRHPIVEAIMTEGEFVPNDVRLDEETQILLITGPNMAGKSTFLRQTALIVLMAQIGSFVPAEKARVGIVDRVFTRVGASDDLATGQSTFMVEMNEVANILNHATEKSLILLDEVGRGTSTFDGLSIAWAVTEHVHNRWSQGPKTLFATHYHELTELEDVLPRLKNFTVAVHKEGSDIVFLRRIVPGGADQSYGIEVARLAGLPRDVIERAQHILATLEAQGKGTGLKTEVIGTSSYANGKEEIAAAAEPTAIKPSPAPVDPSRAPDHTIPSVQIPLFSEPDPILMRLSSVNINEMTPLEALNFLGEIQQQLEKRGMVIGAAGSEQRKGSL